MAASLAPGASVSVIARQYDVNANQVFAWRKLFRDGGLGTAPMQLVPVAVEPDTEPVAEASSGSDLIEIELGRYCLRIGSGFKASALRQVLDVLERR